MTIEIEKPTAAFFLASDVEECRKMHEAQIILWDRQTSDHAQPRRRLQFNGGGAEVADVLEEIGGSFDDWQIMEVKRDTK